MVDMNDAICGKDSCPAVVGNIVVLRDNHHLTATYALALAPYWPRQRDFEQLSRRNGMALRRVVDLA